MQLSVGEAMVQYDERLTSPEQLKTVVKGAGYGVSATDTAQKLRGKGWVLRLIISESTRQG